MQRLPRVRHAGVIAVGAAHDRAGGTRRAAAHTALVDHDDAPSPPGSVGGDRGPDDAGTDDHRVRCVPHRSNCRRGGDDSACTTVETRRDAARQWMNGATPVRGGLRSCAAGLPVASPSVGSEFSTACRKRPRATVFAASSTEGTQHGEAGQPHVLQPSVPDPVELTRLVRHGVGDGGEVGHRPDRDDEPVDDAGPAGRPAPTARRNEPGDAGDESRRGDAGGRRSHRQGGKPPARDVVVHRLRGAADIGSPIPRMWLARGRIDGDAPIRQPCLRQAGHSCGGGEPGSCPEAQPRRGDDDERPTDEVGEQSGAAVRKSRTIRASPPTIIGITTTTALRWPNRPTGFRTWRCASTTQGCSCGGSRPTRRVRLRPPSGFE
jgi:hypothetical protein